MLVADKRREVFSVSHSEGASCANSRRAAQDL